MRFTWWRAAFITLAALTASACGGGGGSGGVPPMVTAPGSQNGGGKFNVAGFPAAFTEYPMPSGLTPIDVTIGPDGALWFSSSKFFDTSTIAMGTLTSTGAVRTVMLPKVTEDFVTVQLFSGSGAIASDAGALWSIATDPSRMDESLLMRNTPTSTSAQAGDLGTCCGSPVQKIIEGPDGNLWLTACFESCPEFSAFIESFSPSGGSGVFVRLGSLASGITYQGNSVAAGPDHNIYVTAVFTGVPGASAPDSSVFQISLSGTILNQFPLPTGSAPIGIVTGPDKNLWIAENGTNKIARMDTSGHVTEFPIPAPGAGPQMITSGSDGAAWFTEDPGNALGRITTTGAITQFPIPTPNAHPFGIVSCPSACENAHGRIWFAETAGKIGKFEF